MLNYARPSGMTNGFSYIGFPGIQACWNPCACKLKVEGTGSISLQPDIAVVDLGVITENRQLAVAQEENSEKMTAVINTLKGMGIPSRDIQTQTFNITPQYDFVEGRQVFRGYRVEHIMEVKVRDINRLGSIIDAAVQSGANQVNGIEFTVSEPEIYYQQALKAAVDDALTKAGTLATKLNIQVGNIPVQIIELGTEAPPVPLMYQTAAVTPIQPGQIKITARIEAVFAYWHVH